MRELVDGTGAVRARYDYDPYGRVTKLSGDRDSLFLYTGHLWHQQSGLFLTMFRAYDPALGRWISRDPLAEAGGINLYAYVVNNPISLIDPLGLSWSDFGLGLAHAAVGVVAAVVVVAVITAFLAPVAAAVALAALLGYAAYNVGGALAEMSDPCTSSARWDYLAGNLIGGALFGAAAGGAFAGMGAAPPALSPSEVGMADSSIMQAPMSGDVAGTTGNAGLGNPFNGKSATEIDGMFRAKGFDPRGPDPVNGKGGYVNPRTGRSYHIDEANSFGEPPHVDVNRPRGYDGPLPKKKYPF